MKYYAARETAYQKLEKLGLTHWDQLSNPHWSPGDSRVMAYVLTLINKQIVNNDERPRALDIGCGTGELVRILCERGFDATGIDISETAIGLANRYVGKSGCDNALFEVRDICTWTPQIKFDLIIDNHCLHCLIFPEDRFAALTNIRRMLASGGTFVTESMIADEGMTFGDGFELDSDGVLWNRSKTEKNNSGWTRRGNSWYFPNCRIVTKNYFLDELKQAGLPVIKYVLIAPDKHGEPASLIAECSNREG